MAECGMPCRAPDCAGTHDCRGRTRRRWLLCGSPAQNGLGAAVLILAACLFCWPVGWPAQASERAVAPRVPSVSLSELSLIDDPLEGAMISGQVRVTLSGALIQAIERGVPLRFHAEFQVTEPRWWWWDRQVFLGQQTFSSTP
ncbi:MAG: DUF4390 domain-containing protein [Betaproteobacteria bacterium]|nr:DUF4390 domain-containing protein [Betaproteobacteria bacterium]